MSKSNDQRDSAEACTEVIKMRICSADKLRVQQIADSELRSFSNQMLLIVRDWVRRYDKL